jgi:uncharacterized protein with HEPN domain
VPPREWRLRIEDILESIIKIQRYTEGMTFDAFVDDEKTIDAVTRNFTIIGEAACHIPQEIEDRYQNVLWFRMRGMRNIVVHEYFGVDLPTVWQTIQQDISVLVPQLRHILEEAG